MLEDRTLRFQLDRLDGSIPVGFSVRQVICAGYSGRSQESVQAHVRELIELGMPAPDSTPIFFKVSHYLATSASTVTVQDRLTSGEVEFVLLFEKGRTLVTTGSDHTHRGMEKYSIPAAKQMHPKVLAPVAWLMEDVADHWDRITLRSWATVNGVRNLYQEATLAHILPPAELLELAGAHCRVSDDGTVFMSGTVPTAGGRLVYADRFEFEMHDPVRHRTIAHAYDVVVL